MVGFQVTIALYKGEIGHELLQRRLFVWLT